MSQTNWADAQIPSTATYTETSLASASYSEASANTTDWDRAGGIDAATTYDDSTLAYDDSATYYDGYDATTITADDVKFTAFTEAGAVSNASWTDIT